jgi:hypothetical protein
MHAHARVLYYMCECVCSYYFANPSTVSVCLSAVIYTHRKHTVVK